MNKLISFILIFFSISIIQAQNSKSFTLTEAIEYASKNNPTIKNAKIDIEKAKKKIWETTAIGLPQANLKMGFVTPTYGILQPDNKTVLMEYDEIPIKLGVPNSTQIDASISQLLFNGAYFVGLQATKTFKQLSEQNLEMSLNDLTMDITNSYYLVLVMEENKRILKQNMTNIDTTLFELQAMFKEGFIEDTDVDQIEYTATMIKNAYNTIERQTEIAYNLLKFQMGMELTEEIELTDELTSVVEQIALESLIGGETDITNNTTYKMVQTQETLQELNLKREKTSFLPTVVAFYNHQEKTNRADFDFTMPDMIGVNVDIPVFSSWQRMSKVKQAELELVKTRNLKEQAIAGIKLQIQQAQLTLESAYKSYLNETRNLELTKKIYNKTLLKYKEGISSSMELTQANTQYLTAQSNYFTAVNQLLQAKSKLDNLLNRN